MSDGVTMCSIETLRPTTAVSPITMPVPELVGGREEGEG